MAPKVLLCPSILSADFGRLAQEVREVEAAGADWIHVDIMDGHFVPNMTVGPGVVKALRKATRLPLDVHLMVADAERWVRPFADAGADYISVHAEACVHLEQVVRLIRDVGKRPGVALNPHTGEQVLEYVVDQLDLVLAMTVNPGFGGQAFLPSQLPKVRRLRELLDARNPDALLQVDGGVSPTTAGDLVAAGANVLVAGAAVFGQADRAAAMAAIRAAVP
jgi:ribulose-phosphate 3-epimerase